MVGQTAAAPIDHALVQITRPIFLLQPQIYKRHEVSMFRKFWLLSKRTLKHSFQNPALMLAQVMALLI